MLDYRRLCFALGLPNTVMVTGERPNEGPIEIMLGVDLPAAPDTPKELTLFYGAEHLPLHPGCKTKYNRKETTWHDEHKRLLKSLTKENYLVEGPGAPAMTHAVTTIQLPGISAANPIVV